MSSLYPKRVWVDFVHILEEFWDLLVSLPNDWTDEGIDTIVDDHERDQRIPAEAPLELVVQILLNLHDPVDHLTTPGKFSKKGKPSS